MKLSWPVDRKFRVNQYWGEDPQYYAQLKMPGHNGWDFGVPEGTPVFASHDGVVWFAGTDDSRAKEVSIDTHDGLFRTFYGHLSSYSVTPGQVVKQGEQIGLSGNTGKYTLGAHLHFGIHHIYNHSDVEPYNGWNGACDPAPYFNGLTRSLYLTCSGEDVTVLQTYLKSQGYFTGKITSYYGPITMRAVRDYQRANGLTPALGQCGPLTRGLINKSLS